MTEIEWKDACAELAIPVAKFFTATRGKDLFARKAWVEYQNYIYALRGQKEFDCHKYAAWGYLVGGSFSCSSTPEVDFPGEYSLAMWCQNVVDGIYVHTNEWLMEFMLKDLFGYGV